MTRRRSPSTKKCSYKTYRRNRPRAIARDGGCRAEGCTEARRERLTVHHIKSAAEGGNNSLANLMTLCLQHHVLVHQKRGN